MYSREVGISRGAFFFKFFSCKEGLYAIKTGKRDNDVFFNVHRIPLQLLVNQECRTTNCGSYAKQSPFTSDYTCNHMYIYTIVQKLSIFTLFWSVLSCKYIESDSLLEKKKLLERFELAIFNKSARLRPLHLSGRYSYISTVMIQ